MQTHSTASKSAARRHRPKTLTVFAAAFAAGAVLAYGVDRMVDVHIVRVEPQVESEPIFVALRSLPQGSPVTVWDVALKDWPKAMLPTTALKADASFEGMVLRHPVREGQPLLSVQLVRDGGLLPGADVAALPAAAGPADARIPVTAPVLGGTIGERFVPAAPAEPAATSTAAAIPSPAVRATEPAPVSLPVSEPEPVVTEPTPVAAVATVPATAIETRDDSAPAGAPSDHVSRDHVPVIVAVVQPRSTDVDEAGVAPVGVPTAATPATVPMPAAPDVAAAAPLPAQPPAQTSAPAAVAPVSETALAPPVPTLPPTDIERSLAGFAPAQATAVAIRPAPAGQPASVLDRTTEAEPPTPAQTAPKLHLVVPERIALAADASFAQPQTAAREAPVAQSGSAALANSASQAWEPARGGTHAASAPQQSRAAAHKPTAANPAARKQSVSRPPATKPQPPQTRGVSAWLPTFIGGSRQR